MQRLLATAWCVALGIALMVGSPLTPSGSGVRSPLTPSLSPFLRGERGQGVELDPSSPPQGVELDPPSPPQGVGGFKHLPSER